MFSGIASLRLRWRGSRRRSPNIASDRSADQFGSYSAGTTTPPTVAVSPL
jgi:hypothetical protein